MRLDLPCRPAGAVLIVQHDQIRAVGSFSHHEQPVLYGIGLQIGHFRQHFGGGEIYCLPAVRDHPDIHCQLMALAFELVHGDGEPVTRPEVEAEGQGRLHR